MNPVLNSDIGVEVARPGMIDRSLFVGQPNFTWLGIWLSSPQVLPGPIGHARASPLRCVMSDPPDNVTLVYVTESGIAFGLWLNG